MHIRNEYKKIRVILYTFLLSLFVNHVHAKPNRQRTQQKQGNIFIKVYEQIDRYAREFNKATNEIQIKQIENKLVLSLFNQFPEAKFLTHSALVSPGNELNPNHPNLLQNRIPELKQVKFQQHAAEFERTMASMINHTKNLALYQYLTQKSHNTLTHYQAHLKHLGISDRFTKTEQDVQNRLAFLKQVYADKTKIGKVGYLTLINDLFKVAHFAQDFPGKEHDQAAVKAIASEQRSKYFPSLKEKTTVEEMHKLLQANEFATLAQINQGEAPAIGLQGLWRILDRQDLVDITVMEQLLDIAGADASANGPQYQVIIPLEKSLNNLPKVLKAATSNLQVQTPAPYQTVYNQFITSKFPSGIKPQDIIEARFMAMIRMEQKQPDDAVEQLNAFRVARTSLSEKEQKQLNHLFAPQTNIMVMHAPDFISNVQTAVNKVTVNKQPYLVQGYQFALKRMIQFAEAASYLHDQDNSLSIVNISDAVIPAKQILTCSFQAQEKGQPHYQAVLQQHNCKITSFSGGRLSLAYFKTLLAAKKMPEIREFVQNMSNEPKLLEVVQAAMYQSNDPEIINLLKNTRQPQRLFIGSGGGSDPLTAATFAHQDHQKQERIIIGSSRHCPADLQALMEQARVETICLDNQNGIVSLLGDGLIYAEADNPDFHRTTQIESSIGIQAIPMLVMNRSLNVFDQTEGSDADKLIKALAKYLTAYRINTIISVDTGCDINGLGKRESQNQVINAVEGDVKHAVIMDAAIENARTLYGHQVNYHIQAVAPGIDNQTTIAQQEAFIKQYHLNPIKLSASYFEDLYARTAKQLNTRTAKQIATLGKFFGNMTADQHKALTKYLKRKHKKEKDLNELMKHFGITKNQPQIHDDFANTLARLQLQGNQIMYQTQDRRALSGQLLALDLATAYLNISHQQLKSIIKNNYQATYVRQVLEAHIHHINQLEAKQVQGPQLKQAYDDAKKYVLLAKNGTAELVNIAVKQPSKGAINLIKVVGKDAERLFADSANKSASL